MDMGAATGIANRRPELSDGLTALLTLIDERGESAWLGLGHRLASLLGVPASVDAVGQVAHVEAATGAQQLLDAVRATNPESTVVEGAE